MEYDSLQQLNNNDQQQYEVPPSHGHRKRAGTLAIIIGIIVVTVLIILFLFVPMKNISENIDVEIPKGASVTRAAHILDDAGVIGVPQVFKTLVMLRDTPIVAGTYRFEEPVSIIQAARRLMQGEYGDVAVRVVIPEGSTNEQIIDAVTTALPNVSESKLRALVQGKEGYLYPDTYFFFPNVSAEDIVQTLEKTFQEKIQALETEIADSDRSFEDIITMASIVEKESYDDDQERATIAGILWKRIDKGMLLQIDATFLYYLGKTSAEVTRDDLQDDSPYNTYVHDGLPPTPIGNPSLASIRAALNPIDSPYYFYLHDENGTVHYARTHDGHVVNKNNHLR